MNNIRENEFGSANVRGEVAFFSETGSEEIGRGEENVPPRVKTWNKWCSPTDFQTWIHASRDILLYPARCVCCYRVWWFRVAVIVSQNIKKATWVIKMLSRLRRNVSLNWARTDSPATWDCCRAKIPIEARLQVHKSPWWLLTHANHGKFRQHKSTPYLNHLSP